MRVAARRSGVAMGLVVLLTVALTLLVHAALLLSRAEMWVTRVDARRVEARGHSRAALARYHRSLDSLPASGVVATTLGVVTAERLSPELALLTSRPGDGFPLVAHGAGAGRVLYAPDPWTRVQARSVGVTAGQGLAREVGADVGPALDGTRCDPRLLGVADFQRRPWTPGMALLGVLTFEELARRLPVGATGAGLPAGAPWVVTDTLLGAWAVQGDVVLQAASLVRGWLWVDGQVVLEPGSRLEGFLDASGTVRVRGGGTLQTSPCAALAGLLEGSDLRSPWRIGPAAWPIP